MTIFDDYEVAKEFAEIRLEEMEADERILIMKKNDKYLVTCDYREAKRDGWELYTQLFN